MLKRYRWWILAAILVSAFGLLLVRENSREKRYDLHTFRGGFRPQLVNGWCANDTIFMKGWCEQYRTKVRGGFASDYEVLNISQDTFWQWPMCIEAIDACKEYSQNPNKGLALDIDGFNGGNPLWWWALSLSRNPDATMALLNQWAEKQR